MYFLEKVGVYGHGVFWIGGDIEEGKRQADKNASMDVDGYHKWNLYHFKEVQDSTVDADHAVAYTGVRSATKE